MKRLRVLVSALLITMLSVSSVSATVVGVTTFKSINNTNESTFKSTKDELENIANSVNTSSDKVNIELGSTYKDTKNMETTLAWLIENDIISKDVTFSSDGLSYSVKPINYYTSLSSQFAVKKSDVVMGFAKAIYGVQQSRPVIIKTRNKVNQDSSGDIVYDYSEGNYNVYVTPNVYELYFRQLLDKGIINISEFSNVGFINEYNSYGKNNKFPAWSTELGNSLNNSSKFNGKGSILGSTLSIEGNPIYGEINSTFNGVSYFSNETMLKIDALKLIEKLMRATEKDMTKAESEIITYKYGADYLVSLDSESRKTIMFLIAKGVMNFEDASEFQDLYAPLTVDYFHTLLYRVANKDARLDFSKIQLTDNDNYWLLKGFYQKTLDLYDSGIFTPETTVTLYKEVAQVDTGIIRNREIVLKANSEQQWQVERKYKLAYEYTYKGKPVNEIEPKSKGFEEVISKDIAGDYVTLKFKIGATDSAIAVAIIDSRTRSASSNSKVTSIDTVAKVGKLDGDDKVTKEEIYISKSSLPKLGSGNSQNEISALNDKYLINTRTGTKAILLDNNKTALIGNEVIITSENIVTGKNGEVYYNMDIIARLMSHSYLNSVTGDLYLGASSSQLMYQDHTDILNYYDGVVAKNGVDPASNPDAFSVVDKTFIADVNVHKVDGNKVDKDSELVNKKFYSLLHAQKAISTIYRDVRSDLNSKDERILLVEWKYSLPSQPDELNSDIINKINEQFGTKDPSVKAMTDFLNTKPASVELAKYWDTNLALSNALANYIYNTQNVTYFTSGYLLPKVTLLGTGEIKDSDIDTLLNKLTFTGEFRQKYIGSNTVRQALFGAKTGVYGQMTTERTFTKIEGNKLGDIIEYGDYILDTTGTLYKSFGHFSDNDPDNDGLEKTMDQFTYSKGGRTVWYVAQISREVSPIDRADPFQLNGEYNINGEQYIYVGDKFSPAGDSYGVFVKKTPIDGRMMKNENGKFDFFTNLDGGDNYTLTINQWISRKRAATTNINNGTYFFMPQINEYSYWNGIPPGAENPKESDYNILGYNDTTTENKELIVKSGNVNTRRSNLNIGSANKVYAYPMVVVRKYNWVTTSDNTLSPELFSPYFIRNNIINSGLTLAIQDSIIAQDAGAVSVGGIPTGKKVVIGDMNFTAQGGRLISNPISNTRVVGSMQGQATKDKVLASAVGELLQGLNLSLVINGYLKDSKALSDYIAVANEKPQVSFADAPAETTGITRCLVKKGDNYYLRNGDKTSAYSEGTSFSSFIFSVKFNDAIKFIPLDANKDTYGLLYSVTSDVNGAMSNVPFFRGTLSYNWSEEIYNSLTRSDYKEAIDAYGIMDKIKAAYTLQQRKDILGLLRMLVVNLLSWMIVMNLITFAVQKLDTPMTFLRAIREPKKGGKFGPDILKIVSIGLTSLDNENSLIRVIGIDMVLVILLTLIIQFTT